MSYRIPFLLDSLHKHKLAGLEEALSVSHWRSPEAVAMFAQVEVKISQRLKRRNMQRTGDEWPGKSGIAELMLQKKTEECRIISSMTGRSRQQDWSSGAAAQKRVNIQRKDIWGISIVVAQFYSIHTSNVLQYILGSLTNPSIRTVYLQVNINFTIIRINHGDMEGYGH